MEITFSIFDTLAGLTLSSPSENHHLCTAAVDKDIKGFAVLASKT
jgi:hypothetical protein